MCPPVRSPHLPHTCGEGRDSALMVTNCTPASTALSLRPRRTSITQAVLPVPGIPQMYMTPELSASGVISVTEGAEGGCNQKDKCGKYVVWNNEFKVFKQN